MKFAHEVEERRGAASVLINNAGIIRRTVFDDKAFLADLDMTLSINVKGSVNMTTAFLQQLRSTQGRIINLRIDHVLCRRVKKRLLCRK